MPTTSNRDLQGQTIDSWSKYLSLCTLTANNPDLFKAIRPIATPYWPYWAIDSWPQYLGLGILTTSNPDVQS